MTHGLEESSQVRGTHQSEDGLQYLISVITRMQQFCCTLATFSVVVNYDLWKKNGGRTATKGNEMMPSKRCSYTVILKQSHITDVKADQRGRGEELYLSMFPNA